MNLENIALGSLGAKVIDHSSSSDAHHYPPSNVLSPKEEEIWNSAEGLPQFITISLQQVSLKYSHIGRLGFYCWHDYTTNPKVIEMQVAPSEHDKMVLWARLTLKHQSGKQFFSIKPLPATYRIVKLTITETFGDYQTYLNQVYIEAQMEDSQLGSMMGLNDLESPLRSAHLPAYKDRKYMENKRPGQSYNRPKDSSGSEDEEDFVENTFHNRQVNSPSKQNYTASAHSYSKHSSKFSQEEEQQEAVGDKSYQNDMALLTLSKNVIEMQQNVQQIKRALEVLNMRIDVTYQKLEQKMMERVQQLIDKKMARIKQEIRNQFKNNQLKQSKSQHAFQLMSSNDRLPDYQMEREAKQSLHIHNLKSNRVERESSKDIIVTDLMDKLAKKLKERELKIKKIESKRQRDRPDRGGSRRDII